MKDKSTEKSKQRVPAVIVGESFKGKFKKHQIVQDVLELHLRKKPNLSEKNRFSVEE